MSTERDFVTDHREDLLADLDQWLRIPGISAQPEYHGDVARSADWFAEAARRTGFPTVEIWPTAGLPTVFAEWPSDDLDAPVVLETIDKVFQKAELARGELMYRGTRRVNPGAITRTALLTVEGERDDICAVGQTAAAHTLCTSLRPHMQRHHLQPGVGHYGVFSGSKWEKQVYPQVRNIILAMS